MATAFQASAFQRSPAFQIDEAVVQQPQQQPQQQAAGGVYAPSRKRKPERLVFLERELLEKIEREREIVRAKPATEVPVARSELGQLRTEIAALRALIVHEMTLQHEQDEDDAVTVVLMAATLH